MVTIEKCVFFCPSLCNTQLLALAARRHMHQLLARHAHTSRPSGDGMYRIFVLTLETRTMCADAVQL
jgi:hypothetical protein